MKLKERKCKNCDHFFTPRKPLQYLCGHDCQREYESRLRSKEPNENNTEKSLIQLRNEAREVFQKWIKIRDENLPCISCNSKEAIQWDGGHLFKAELFTGLIFHEINCNKQCSTCNNDGDGNIENYKVGFIKKYGEAVYNGLEELSKYKRFYKFTREELIQIKKEYQQKIKDYARDPK